MDLLHYVLLKFQRVVVLLLWLQLGSAQSPTTPPKVPNSKCSRDVWPKCGPYARCSLVPTDPGYYCICLYGYVGDPMNGTYCQNIELFKCDAVHPIVGCIPTSESFPRINFSRTVAVTFLSLSLLLVTSSVLGI